MENDSQCIWHISHEHNITYVNDAWIQFAKANDAGHLSRDAVVGRSLWDFITDQDTRFLYSGLFTKVRQSRSPLFITARCDSPAVYRRINIEVAPLSGEDIALRSRILLEKQHQSYPVNQGKQHRPSTALRLCSWCKKVQTTDNQWLDLETVINGHDLFSGQEGVACVNVTCPRCYESILAAFSSDPVI